MGTQKHRSRHNIHAGRELRSTQTPAEETLWQALRNRKLAGLKFRRQHPIGPFMADFCCPDRRLIIELDGSVHARMQEEDSAREAILVAAGYTVLRFDNGAVAEDLSAVLNAILTTAEGLPAYEGTPPFRAGPWQTRR
ncbi:MAG: endonuclease domain-containing protein [Thermomicrobiales bacterium]